MINSPYVEDADAEWYRGNLHTHTEHSPDSTRPVANVISDYEEREYDFLTLTDHDTFVDPADYQERTTMSLISGIEVTDNSTHVSALNINSAITPDPDRQTVLDAVAEDDGIAVLPHPNWGPEFEHYSQEKLAGLNGYAGIEVYNGASERGQGSSLATDHWDRLLSNGHVVWGYANDDSHRPNDVEKAWNVVQTTESTPTAIISALRTGCCYASTGVTIEEITADSDTVSIQTTNAATIRLIADYGTVHRVVESATASFDVPGDLRPDVDSSYVRIECLGSGNQTAWTQPLFLDGRIE
jgi:hypothetical protein